MLVFYDLISFLKKPNQRSSSLIGFKDKLIFTFKLLGLCIILNLIYLLVFIIFNLLGQSEDSQINNESMVMLFFGACIMAPIFEEFLFRYPLIYKRNYLFLALSEVVRLKRGTNQIEHRILAKRFYKKYFVIFFYLMAIAFSISHISRFNYTEMSNYQLIFQLITLPQLIAGLILGYVRIRVGIFFSILLHAFFNLFLLTMFSIQRFV